jgi:hypothetical protein
MLFVKISLQFYFILSLYINLFINLTQDEFKKFRINYIVTIIAISHIIAQTLNFHKASLYLFGYF